jgi:predicted kinase
VLVVLSGRSGAGKTTIARVLAAALPAVHLRIDSIEQALRRSGVEVRAEGYAVAHAVAEDNLRLGHRVIADSVNPWPLTRLEWRAVAARAGVAVVDVEVVCSDAAEHQRRVESRATDITGLVVPTWREVMARDYRPWDSERLVVDSALLTVAESVALIAAAVAAPA